MCVSGSERHSGPKQLQCIVLNRGIYIKTYMLSEVFNIESCPLTENLLLSVSICLFLCNLIIRRIIIRIIITIIIMIIIIISAYLMYSMYSEALIKNTCDWLCRSC